VNTVSHSMQLNLLSLTPIVTCNRRIYAYHTCQSRSYIIETDRRDIIHVLGGVHTRTTTLVSWRWTRPYR